MAQRLVIKTREPFSVDEFDFVLREISRSSPQAWALYDGQRQLGQMHLDEGVFSVWAWRPGQPDPVEIHRRDVGRAHFSRFTDEMTCQQALGYGILYLKAHAQECRVSLVANDSNPPAPPLRPA